MTEDEEAEAHRRVEEFRTNSPFRRLYDILYRDTKDSRVHVLVTNGWLEVIVNGIIDARCKNAKTITGDTRGFPYSSKLIILHELGILPDHHFRLLNFFRKLRNDAAHEPDFVITPERLEQLAKPHHRDPAKFNDVCYKVMLELWLELKVHMMCVMAPSLVEESNDPELYISVPSPKYIVPLKSDPERISFKASEYTPELKAKYSPKKTSDDDKLKT